MTWIHEYGLEHYFDIFYPCLQHPLELHDLNFHGPASTFNSSLFEDESESKKNRSANPQCRFVDVDLFNRHCYLNSWRYVGYMLLHCHFYPHVVGIVSVVLSHPWRMVLQEALRCVPVPKSLEVGLNTRKTGLSFGTETQNSEKPWVYFMLC